MDYLRFIIIYLKSRKLIKSFRNKYPNVKTPPPFYIYETFGIDYFKYYEGGKRTAIWLKQFFDKHSKNTDLKILDWGCGPARTIRHFNEIYGDSCSLYASDYNKKYIKWCSENIDNVTFKNNELKPPLKFESNFFDVVYGISIFTHLSHEMHIAWFNELFRVLKPGGILFLTLHGKAFREKLTKSERELFDNEELVIKTSSKEGHRTYAAFQPVSYVKNLLKENQLLEHIEGKVKNDKPEQDIWIMRKK